MMLTFVLALSALTISTHSRFLVPSFQKTVEQEVTSIDTSLLVDPPSLRFTSHTNLTDARFQSGEPLYFYCEAVGTPLVNVYWTLNGRVIQGHRRRSFLETLRNQGKLMIGQNVVGSSLELDCIDERITGTLSCVADNGIEIKKNSVQISTTGPKTCSRMRPDRPQIGSFTKSRIEEIGNAVVFQCRKASGSSTIRWENEDGKELKKEDGFMALPNGDMLIPNLKWEHMGSYTCVASNEEGEDRSEVFIFPTDKDAGNGDGEEDDSDY